MRKCGLKTGISQEGGLLTELPLKQPKPLSVPLCNQNLTIWVFQIFLYLAVPSRFLINCRRYRIVLLGLFLRYNNKTMYFLFCNPSTGYQSTPESTNSKHPQSLSQIPLTSCISDLLNNITSLFTTSLFSSNTLRVPNIKTKLFKQRHVSFSAQNTGSRFPKKSTTFELQLRSKQP